MREIGKKQKKKGYDPGWRSPPPRSTRCAEPLPGMN
jgi:hypothetical protein